MRDPLLRFAGALVAVSLAACSSDGPNSLRDSSAMAVLQEDAWSRDIRAFKLGAVQFRRGDPDGPPYAMYRELAERGLLHLENERDLSAGFTGWNDFFALTQAGVQRTATVSLTPEGKRIGSHQNAGSANEHVTFLFSRNEVEKVVSNEGLDINGDKYRVIQGTYNLEPTSDLFIAVMESFGVDMSRERRFRALLKYDVFDTKWKLQVSDDGLREGDFWSQRVPSALAELRLTGGR